MNDDVPPWRHTCDTCGAVTWFRPEPMDLRVYHMENGSHEFRSRSFKDGDWYVARGKPDTPPDALDWLPVARRR